MRKALFEKISPGIITLKIDEVPTKIKQGQMFIHYYEIVNGLPGIKFIRFLENEKNILINDTETKNNIFQGEEKQIQQTEQIQQAEQIKQVENTKETEKLEKSEKVEENQIINQNNEKDKNTQNNSFIMDEEKNVISKNIQIEITCTENTNLENNNFSKEYFLSEEVIKYLSELKTKSKKEIYSLNKKELINIFEKCQIDISNIKNNKTEMYKLLLSLLEKIN
ncbi:MAG: hypothetical protein NZZ41_01150 [Candidatus Dojkabacteria bacterium]|nr:hypothetical protein [Candidatus Dojkabacteria bacterium]